MHFSSCMNQPLHSSQSSDQLKIEMSKILQPAGDDQPPKPRGYFFFVVGE